LCAAGQQSQPSHDLPEDQIQQSYRHDRRSCPTTTLQRCRRSPSWMTSSAPTGFTVRAPICIFAGHSEVYERGLTWSTMMPRGQQLFDVPIRQAVPQVSSDRQQDHLRRKPEPCKTGPGRRHLKLTTAHRPTCPSSSSINASGP
jgi:hypothetical protein